ncbi:hypothetical protein A2755_00360 [Candidatus Wolfebacteria bacterium RIFCSPHIGHO2_01_FULL_48_22]|uniref:DUF192 domain-containing protein n=1 Tax=Candidatus Wolfebacteria bacterium RIFCSPHIGHO2_01_FULL_48_22 TaxID=1802555 RepID=A0A1F8DXM6_9BACT|nr:MAG: hypothetical protein A2755_00360 [Candidatus Wolfebacteria bacterium RIFCSPHIGHO2_01_FULL_48_22]
MNIFFYISIGIIVLCIVALLYGHYLFNAKNWNDSDTARIRIGSLTVQAEVAASAEKKNKGLSGRTELAEDVGMLFIFTKPYRYPFWMKGMLIPLDFIWINDGRVVDVHTNIPYPADGEFPTTIMPAEAVDMVLEVQAGIVERYGITTGDTVSIARNDN